MHVTLKELNFYSGLAKKAAPYGKFYSSQIANLVRQGKFKNAYNYFWAISFTKEEGAAIAEWRYRANPDNAPYPGRIEVEVSTVCPYRCVKCEHTYWKEEQENMTYAQFLHILNQFPDLRAISCSGIGHGFNNPDFPKMLKYVKSKQLFTQFFDPFQVINEERARMLIELGVDKIWMSLDGATKETYEYLQNGLKFDVVIKNAKRLIQLKKEMNSRFPELSFHFIITKENVHEMPDVIDVIHDITKDGKHILNLVQFTKLIPFKENEKHKIADIPQELVNETERRAKKYGNFRLSFCNINEKQPIQECTAWTVPFITVKGEYFPCCAFTQGNVREGLRKYLFGNLFEQHFREIWNSMEMRGFIWDMHKGKIPEVCEFRDCPMYECNSHKRDRENLVQKFSSTTQQQEALLQIRNPD